MPAVAALSVSGLSKAYRLPGLWQRQRRVALEDVSFFIGQGEIFGYLGPNGSGKTTTLKILLGLLRPDSGTWDVLGEPHDCGGWRRRVGFLPENPYLYDYLTVREYVEYAARLFGFPPRECRERAGALLKKGDLERASAIPIRRWSTGMLQRLGLAQALVNDPELVFLDEPMSGLDPLGRRLVREIILDLKRAGKTVFFSTHILSDAEALCDRVAVLRDGRLLRVGTLSDLLRVDASHVEVLTVAPPDFAPRTPVTARQQLGERTRLEVDEAHVGALLAELDKGGCRLLSVQPVRRSLEEYFFKELGQEGTWLAED